MGQAIQLPFVQSWLAYSTSWVWGWGDWGCIVMAHSSQLVSFKLSGPPLRSPDSFSTVSISKMQFCRSAEDRGWLLKLVYRCSAHELQAILKCEKGALRELNGKSLEWFYRVANKFLEWKIIEDLGWGGEVAWCHSRVVSIRKRRGALASLIVIYNRESLAGITIKGARAQSSFPITGCLM